MKTPYSKYYEPKLQNDINKLLSQTKITALHLKKEIKNTPGGNLYIKNTKGYKIFTEYADGQEHSIGKDKDRIYTLARRKYISALYSQMESDYKSLKKFFADIKKHDCGHKIDLLLKEYDTTGLDMSRILLSPEQQAWLSQPYERNPSYPKELKFLTTNGVLMRTKSELMIANRLEYFFIPYLPEMPLWFLYNQYPIYPDFTILKDDGSIIIWEHMGLMDKETYFIKNCKRIMEYRQNGYCLHTNLIITFEEDICEPGLIDKIIKSRILI